MNSLVSERFGFDLKLIHLRFITSGELGHSLECAVCSFILNSEL